MRYPVVAGSFYPLSKSELESAVKGYIANARVKKREAFGGISPHAGYIYSGQTAAYTFATIGNLTKPNTTVVFIGPNHTGMGSPLSISLEDWQTPLGVSQCDKELAKEIKKKSHLLDLDELAHRSEHSIEVQLPFLQLINPKAKIVPICMMRQDLESSLDVGKAVYEASKSEVGKRREIIAIASSDFTHYEQAEIARKKDSAALELIKQLKYEEFQKLVKDFNLSICGHGPIAAMLYYAKLCGAKSADVLKYSNSGETSGDYFQVVGYASAVVFK